MKKKPTRFKVGIVTISEGVTPTKGKAFWELRYTDPDSGMEVKRRVSGLDRDEVSAMADHLTRRAYQGKGYLAGQVVAPTLEEAIVQAMQLSSAREHIKADLLRRSKPFLAFMAEYHPSVKTWDALKPGMLESYVRNCEKAGLAHDSIRLRLTPIKQAWRRMHADYPELVKPVPRIKQKARPKREIVCLDPAEVATLLDWLKTNRPRLWPMACLSALSGLRMLETSALRIKDIKLEQGTVSVNGEGQHQPKTADSERIIPICGEVLDALRCAIQHQTVKPSGEELFTTQRGNLWNVNSLAQAWGKTLRRAARDLGPRFATIPAHRLRSSFATMASRMGAPDRLLKAYMGHKAGDVMGDHYRRIDTDELAAVSTLMEGWRRLEMRNDVRKHSGKFSAQTAI